MPNCEQHGLPCDEQGNCPMCLAEFENAEAKEAEEQQAFREYQGDSYLVDYLIANGVSPAKAEAEFQNPFLLCGWVEDSLERVLRDRVASRAVSEALILQDPHMRSAIKQYMKKQPKGKPGPRAHPISRDHKKDRVLALTEQGLNAAQIGDKLYGGRSTKNAKRVSANLSIARKKAPSRPNN